MSEIPPYPSSGEESAAPSYRPPGAAPTNGYAIASLVLGVVGIFLVPVVGSILALVFGYMARTEIDRSGGAEGGRGLAIAGIVLGWVGIVVGILLLLLFFLVLASLPSFE